MSMAWRTSRALFVALLLLLAALVFVNRGILPDESEHLHVAWLVAQGKRPVLDFFEHHTPLFWSALSVFFRLGVPGPESLYALRALVVLCTLALAWALLRVCRAAGSTAPVAGVAPLVLLAALPSLGRLLLVGRPEMLAMGLFAVALLVWLRGGATIGAAVAGAAMAAASVTSPRIVLLSPVVLLLGDRAPRRLAAAVGGFAAAFAALLAIYSPRLLLFDLRFSALLQHVGGGLSDDPHAVAAEFGIDLSLCAVLAAATSLPRPALARWLVFGAAIAAVSVASAGDHWYAQAFAPLVVWMLLFAAQLEGTVRAELVEPLLSRLLPAVAAGGIAMCLIAAAAEMQSPYSVFGIVRSKREVASALPPGARLLVLPAHHPISMEDSSYWAPVMLSDPPSRLCTAVAEYQARYGAGLLPKCGILDDVRARPPDAITRGVYLTAPKDEWPALQELQARYAPSPALAEAPIPTFRVNVLFPR